MYKMVFINLLVVDLLCMKMFYQVFGFEVVLVYINEQVVCIKISDMIFVMLLVWLFFQIFIDKMIIDLVMYIQVLLCLLCDSCVEVDGFVVKVLVVGGVVLQVLCEYLNMYGYGFIDLDGYMWELMVMLLDVFVQGQVL